MISQVITAAPAGTAPFYEFLDCRTLARRWCLPESWVREQVRSRSIDPTLADEFLGPHNNGMPIRAVWRQCRLWKRPCATSVQPKPLPRMPRCCKLMKADRLSSAEGCVSG